MKVRCLLVALLGIATGLTGTFGAENGKAPELFELREVMEKSTPETVAMVLVDRRGEKETLHVGKSPVLTGSAVESAAVEKDAGTGDPQVLVTLSESGTKKFAELTARKIGQRVAILLEGKVHSAPVINSKISGGKLHISGGFSEAEVQELAAKINRAVKK
jgi:preprotein translocase subunit SecD